MADNIMQALASALAPYMGGGVAKADGTPDIANYLYASGGLFGTCDADPTLINALVGPVGYCGTLRWVGTVLENEIVDSLTGIASSGYDQSTKCGDCGTASFKKCAQATCFGRICQATPEMVADDIGLFANANVPVKALFGNITDPMGNVLFRTGQQVTDQFALQVMGAAYNLRRQHCVDLWAGNPAANAGGRMQMTGLDLLINTGKIDTRSEIACPALDSLIYNYGNQVVGAAGSPNIVAVVAGMIRGFRYRISGMGLDPDSSVQDIVMRPETWDCFASTYACEYGLECQSWTSSGQRVVHQDAREAAQIRDDVMKTQVVIIDGRPYNVYLDNGMTKVNRPVGDQTAHCAEIAIITRVLQGIPAGSASPGGGIIVWGEYQDMSKTLSETIAWLKANTGATHFSVTDGGRYLVASDFSGGLCFDIKIVLKSRVRMSMPQLSGRITNVCCIPTLGPLQYPDVSGSGGIYERDGGPSTSPEEYLYGECWPTHV